MLNVNLAYLSISPNGCRLRLALKLLLLLLSLLLLFVELEHVNRLRVAAEHEELTVLAERQAVHGGAALDAPPNAGGERERELKGKDMTSIMMSIKPKFHKSGAVFDREHPDDRSLLRGRGQPRSGRVEVERGEGRFVGGNHDLRLQIKGVEELNFT